WPPPGREAAAASVSADISRRPRPHRQPGRARVAHRPDPGPGPREHNPHTRGGVVLGSRTDHRTLGPGTGRAVLATSPGVRRLLLSHNIVGTTVNVAGSRTVLALAR